MSSAPEGIPDSEFNRNVYRINAAGEFVWQISSPPSTRYARAPFTRVWRTDTGQLAASRWDGFIYRVDFETGIATEIDFYK